MSMTPTPPSAGWYPAPNGSPEMWWWDGAQWTPPAPAMQPAAHETPSAGFSRLSMVVQLFLVICGAVSIMTIGLETFGLNAITRYEAGDMLAVDLFDQYDRFTFTLSIVSVLATIAAGTLWAIWQYKAAKRVLGRTRRTPGWHAGSWFIPVVSFWFPYQNISDLWRAAGRSRPSWQVLWWALWILSNVVIQISGRLYANAETFDALSVSLGASIVGESLTIVAVPLAILIVRGITREMERNSANLAHPAVV